MDSRRNRGSHDEPQHTESNSPDEPSPRDHRGRGGGTAAALDRTRSDHDRFGRDPASSACPHDGAGPRRHGGIHRFGAAGLGGAGSARRRDRRRRELVLSRPAGVRFRPPVCLHAGGAPPPPAGANPERAVRIGRGALFGGDGPPRCRPGTGTVRDRCRRRQPRVAGAGPAGLLFGQCLPQCRPLLPRPLVSQRRRGFRARRDGAPLRALRLGQPARGVARRRHAALGPRTVRRHLLPKPADLPDTRRPRPRRAVALPAPEARRCARARRRRAADHEGGLDSRRRQLDLRPAPRCAGGFDR